VQPKKPVVAGIDIGSVFSKAVIIRGNGDVIFATLASGGNYREAARKVVKEVLSKAGVSFEDFGAVVATGLGAASVPFPCKQVSDISCQAKGIHCLFPSARTIVDIGGQSTRVIKATAEGNVVDFVMSEKCAAGSGRFLQIISRILGMSIEDIGPVALQAKQPVEFSTNCAVFAESETISRIAEGATKEDILAGVHRAIAAKVANLVERVGLEEDCVLTGGATEDSGLVKRISEVLRARVLVPDHQRITAALGAARIAAQSLDSH